MKRFDHHQARFCLDHSVTYVLVFCVIPLKVFIWRTTPGDIVQQGRGLAFRETQKIQYWRGFRNFREM